MAEAWVSACSELGDAAVEVAVAGSKAVSGYIFFTLLVSHMGINGSIFFYHSVSMFLHSVDEKLHSSERLYSYRSKI